MDSLSANNKKLCTGDGSGAALPSISLSTPSASEGLANGTEKAERRERSPIEREERRGRKDDVVRARVIHLSIIFGALCDVLSLKSFSAPQSQF